MDGSGDFSGERPQDAMKLSDAQSNILNRGTIILVEGDYTSKTFSGKYYLKGINKNNVILKSCSVNLPKVESLTFDNCIPTISSYYTINCDRLSILLFFQ